MTTQPSSVPPTFAQAPGGSWRRLLAFSKASTFVYVVSAERVPPLELAWEWCSLASSQGVVSSVVLVVLVLITSTIHHGGQERKSFLALS